jgi:glycosyltransferase involved in cell wall biosynthesis
VKTLFYTAAHGGFDLSRVPLGGASAVSSFLMNEWHQKSPFHIRFLTPELLVERAPQDYDLVRYSEMTYARFCFDFEKAITDEILKHDPQDAVVLSNDISEGPNFRVLAEKGYPIYTLVHVDVVDYFSTMYLRKWIQAERLTALYERLDHSYLRRTVPGVLKLIFQKQRDSLKYSRGVVVPSDGMKRVLERCYPQIPPEKIHVLPWGLPTLEVDESAASAESEVLRKHYRIPRDAFVLITLSRISPEKGQDRLLKALAQWERSSEFPSREVWLFVCGEAAYMQGVRFKRQLKALARRLKKVRVVFPGYLSGLQKQSYFRLGNLYVFPSRHESYGLTLLEAFQAGLPALVCQHYGAENSVRPEFGELLPAVQETEIPTRMQQALTKLAADPDRLKRMGLQARVFAGKQRFSDTAQRLSTLLVGDLTVGARQPIHEEIV